MPYEEILAEMPKVTDNQQESIYLPLADYLNAGIVRPSEEYFRVLPDGTLVPIVEDGTNVILQEVKTVQLYENGNFIVNPDEGYGAIGKVLLEINVPTLDTSDATIVEGDILEGKFGYANGKKVYGNIKNNRSKSVTLDTDNTEYSLKGYYSGGSVKITIQNPDPITPTRETQIVEAEDGKVLGKVTVNPIPNDYLVPDKTLNITANGTYPDIREYREAIVNVPSEIPEGYYKPEGTKVITRNDMYDIKTYAQVEVNVKLPQYVGYFTKTKDTESILGRWKIDISKLFATPYSREAEVNFGLISGDTVVDSFDKMIWQAGFLTYYKEGVPTNVFNYNDYVNNGAGWITDNISGDPSAIDFGSEPQEVPKDWYDWFVSTSGDLVEINGLYEIDQEKAFKLLQSLSESKTYTVPFVAGNDYTFTSMTFDGKNKFINYDSKTAFTNNDYMSGGNGFIGFESGDYYGNGAMVYFEKGTKTTQEFKDLFLSIVIEEESEVQDELAGTWVFNDNPNSGTFGLLSVGFESNNKSFTTLGFGSNPDMMDGNALVYENGSEVVYAYDFEYTSTWSNEAYKTVTITSKLSEVTNGSTLLAWLKANATKQ